MTENYKTQSLIMMMIICSASSGKKQKAKKGRNHSIWNADP